MFTIRSLHSMYSKSKKWKIFFRGKIKNEGKWSKLSESLDVATQMKRNPESIKKKMIRINL